MKTKKILAVSSGGGHWIQLKRVQYAFKGCNQVYATVNEEYKSDIPSLAKFYTINDATRWDKWGLVKLVFRLTFILLKERPDIVISTGAAPGYLALRLSKIIGAKTIWIDSIANIEHLSLSGDKVSNHVDHCLTQWKHLENDNVKFEGSCL